MKESVRMKKVFKCDYCSWTSHELDGSRSSETQETEEHESKCEFNPHKSEAVSGLTKQVTN